MAAQADGNFVALGGRPDKDGALHEGDAGGLKGNSEAGQTPCETPQAVTTREAEHK